MLIEIYLILQRTGVKAEEWFLFGRELPTGEERNCFWEFWRHNCLGSRLRPWKTLCMIFFVSVEFLKVGLCRNQFLVHTEKKGSPFRGVIFFRYLHNKMIFLTNICLHWKITPNQSNDNETKDEKIHFLASRFLISIGNSDN